MTRLNSSPAQAPADEIIEIDGRTSVEVQRQCIERAYRMSRTRPVTLLLRGLPTEQLDRMLDPVVRAEGLDVWGVRYVRASDDIPFRE